jgi:hypothetical protein
MKKTTEHLANERIMDTREQDRQAIETEGTFSSLIPHPSSLPQPWEEIEDGRYMPRRIRGSCLGRELG